LARSISIFNSHFGWYCWWRVLPVKFFGGLAALGSGMILGREGPTVQIGANVGKMVADACKLEDKESQHTLVASGAGAGITTAFNAPLGGILFVIEELHGEFTYTKSSIKALLVGCISACITYQLIISSDSVLTLPTANAVPLSSLGIFVFLGLLLGVIGSCSNFLILHTRSYLDSFYKKNKYFFVLTGATLAGIFGLLYTFIPELAGSGFTIIPQLVEGVYAFYPLLLILLFRFFATILSFGSGAPGGIFSPTMALGAVIGVLFGFIIQYLFPHYDINFSTYTILAMAGLFAATIRAPLTGIVIIMEMTNGYMLILPQYSFINKNHLELLKLHAHAGIVGWFLLLVFGAGAKLIPMFILGKSTRTKLLKYAAILLNIGLILFLINGYKNEVTFNSIIFGLIIFSGVLCWLIYIISCFKNRARKKIDIPMRHSTISIICLLLAFASLPFVLSHNHGQWITLYAVFIFLGWLPGIILGMTYKTLPFIIWNIKYTNQNGKPKAPMPKDLYNSTILSIQYYVYIACLLITSIAVFSSYNWIMIASAVLWIILAISYLTNVLIIVFTKK